MADNKEKRIADYDSSGNLGVTEMFGAIIFMLISGLKKDYNYYHQVKFQKRNIWTGYIISIILFLSFFIILMCFVNV